MGPAGSKLAEGAVKIVLGWKRMSKRGTEVESADAGGCGGGDSGGDVVVSWAYQC